MPQRQLGELMTELGLISDEQLATVLEVQQQSKRPLGQIIVELGFASGAAVAHALALQSGGALKTEYGFALGVPPKDEKAEDGEGTNGGLPKLRLAPTATAPPARPYLAPVDETETEESPVEEAVEEPAPLAALPAATEQEPEQVEDAQDLEEVAEVEALEEEVEAAGVAVESEEDADAEQPDDVIDEPEAETSPEAEAAEATEPPEVEQLRGEVEHLEAALTEVQAAAVAEHERVQAEASRLEAVVAEANTEWEQRLARLQEERDQATAELESLQTALAESRTEQTEDLTRLQQQREEATAELERLQTALAEAEAAHREKRALLEEERDHAAAEHDRRLAEVEERNSTEREELAAHRDRLREELEDALDRLAAVGPAAEERDRLRTEIEQFEFTLAEAQAAAARDREQLLGDVDRLDTALAEAQAEREQELGRLGAEHQRDREELDRLQTAVAEAQASAAEQERRLAEEREQHAGERDDLVVQREGLQNELGQAFERLGAIGPALEERDELRNRVEELQTTLAEVRESTAAELRRVVEERDKLAAELDEAHELLRQAERVRESQIALEAERDRAVTELERLQSVAAAAQAELEEQTRLLAEEQDRHNADRETLLAQRTVLEQELGSAIEQLAAAASAADEREHQLRLGSERLVDALDAVRGLASELVSGDEQFPEELEADDAETETEGVAEEIEWVDSVSDSEEVEYALFVPGPNGYELVQQAGIPPQPGQTVELLLPERDEPAVFEVVRSGRTLPGGDICVYLAQV
jgi:chromosome segregation ATPase